MEAWELYLLVLLGPWNIFLRQLVMGTSQMNPWNFIIRYIRALVTSLYINGSLGTLFYLPLGHWNLIEHSLEHPCVPICYGNSPYALGTSLFAVLVTRIRDVILRRAQRCSLLDTSKQTTTHARKATTWRRGIIYHDMRTEIQPSRPSHANVRQLQYPTYLTAVKKHINSRRHPSRN